MSCGAELAKRRTEQASISGGIRAAINRRLSRPGVYDSPEASKSSELQLADCQRAGIFTDLIFLSNLYAFFVNLENPRKDPIFVAVGNFLVTTPNCPDIGVPEHVLGNDFCHLLYYHCRIHLLPYSFSCH
ncbi:uncharacterized protein TNIN_283091 [Trichonephila inaurata madagascariensis]|uniref:Uncharacterized protein n=1 Tax=Trichonephila inaurata madagascariensis TaxID=2747483 RepID=A0A8X7CKD5_9ARAC|nr:uncharacterized protein TNIN_283091 [Trichonephila inaurata madagascariensis]